MFMVYTLLELLEIFSFIFFYSLYYYLSFVKFIVECTDLMRLSMALFFLNIFIELTYLVFFDDFFHLIYSEWNIKRFWLRSR